MYAIEARKLTKTYGKHRGITALDLQVEEGAFFGFIGPNGAGKSTTIRTLLGLIAPTSGSGSVLGRDITARREELLGQVGYLPSEVQFYPGMRVGEVLKFSARLRGKDCTQRAQELCHRLRLSEGRRVEELSLGNRKKVAIVCALQHDPRLCILDEPTSGLDPLMQREFFTILKEYHASGTTIFLSSHVLSEVRRYCTAGVILREGTVAAALGREELGLSEEAFEDLFLGYYEEGGEAL